MHRYNALRAGIALVIALLPAYARSQSPNVLSAMPAGYHLQAYDDCGAPGLETHLLNPESHTFTPEEVKADERVRTVAWGWKQVQAVYERLDASLDYVLAVTYANERFNNRVQSLWAGDVLIHPAHALPKGGWERLLFRVPRGAIQGGRLALQFRLEAQVNVVVSVLELWAAAPSPRVLRVADLSGMYSDLQGRLLDLACDPVAGGLVRLQRGATPLATATSGSDGGFSFPRRLLDHTPHGDLRLVAEQGGVAASRTVRADELYFEPVRYRPVPTRVAGLTQHELSLDGAWRISTGSPAESRRQSLSGPVWRGITVPGQWLQQGIDVPQSRPVAMGREFVLPAKWAGYRIILRFDSIHAGTKYWLNGKYLGRSENLFTPVEWDVTDTARPGRNRLDLEMVVDTPSEKLSYSSGYAFHSLGGIDRTVRLFALPTAHVRDLHVAVDLDRSYRDASVTIELGLHNGGARATKGLSLAVSLTGPSGKAVPCEPAEVAIGPLRGGRPVRIGVKVSDPAKWEAEHPRLHRLAIELRQGGKMIERIERTIGFRKLEWGNGQLRVNGRPVKLAGACHHELDPLTGRADTAHHAEEDVRLMKEANLNYIRTSHYPPCQELLDAADRLGMYVEVEAPFCWVGDVDDMRLLPQVLTPTSAMIDYCHSHPSVIVWSLANESTFNRLFEVSNRLCKALDPSRPTTFNNPDPKRICDIANLHYPPMPYDAQLPADPRPIFLGEHFFPICHEQTDVRIDPGLRELWGAGHSDPGSAWGKLCAESYDPSYMRPGALPGTWTHMVHSKRVIGGAIWAALDEPFYFANGKRAGYAWVHGFWGIIDAWRRPKPEWWLSKLIFSPVWFPARHVEYTSGQREVRLPVENRYSFTDLSELRFSWELGKLSGMARASVPPDASGEVALAVPPGTAEGAALILRVMDSSNRLVTAAAVTLGHEPPKQRPAPGGGPPTWHDDGRQIAISGERFRFSLDKATGRFSAENGSFPPMLELPSPHVTQYDFGDLAGPLRRPYAVLPDQGSRKIESVTAEERAEGLRMVVKESYAGFSGSSSWLLDRYGLGRIDYDYIYSGPDMSAREIGLRFLLPGTWDTLRWRRWSEWGVYPDGSLSRLEGSAPARMPGVSPEGTRPRLPWLYDQTELGTVDFRSVKLNVTDAELSSREEVGLRVMPNADKHARACLDPAGVKLHVLTECRLGPVILKTGDHVKGSFVVELITGRRQVGLAQRSGAAK